MPQDFRIERFASLGSTNDEAMARARAGDPGGLWICADQQTSGRGRQGRVWSSPPGNLYASLLLIDPASPALAPQLGFAAGLALTDVLLAHAPQLAFRLKWPNDVLLDGAKVAGILLEGSMLADGRFAVVIGCGVNCAAHPDALPYAATNLADAGVALEPVDLLAVLAGAMADRIGRWQAGAGFAGLRSDWLSRAAGLGEIISVRLPDRQETGVFLSLDDNGRLLLDTAHGRVTIDAGDVFLPEAGAKARPGSER